MKPTLADLRPGDIMFGPIHGFVPGVFPVGVGQVLLANRRARLSWRRWWEIRHVGVVVEASPRATVIGNSEHLSWAADYLDSLGGPRLVQAMPHGAEEIPLGEKHWTPEYVYVRPTYEDDEGWHVASLARGYLGTPYNFLTYGKLAAGVLRMRMTENILRRWISTRRDMMCSQLVDQCLADAGFHVFDDGRLPQDVVPAELFRQLLTMPGRYLIPGRDWSDNQNRW